VREYGELVPGVNFKPLFAAKVLWLAITQDQLRSKRKGKLLKKSWGEMLLSGQLKTIFDVIAQLTMADPVRSREHSERRIGRK